MDLGDRLVGFVLQSHPHGSVEGAALGIDVDGRIDGCDFRLVEVFVLLELAFVVSLNAAACLRIEILIPDVSVVEVPGAGPQRDDGKQESGRNEPRSTLKG